MSFRNNFFNFFLILNFFIGARRQLHNSFLSHTTLFGFNGYSIINYKMIKIQFRMILFLLHNLILRKHDVTVTNYDKEFENISYLTEFDSNYLINVAEEWISPAISNKPGNFLSKDFLVQQAFSAFLNSFVILNIGNIAHGDLNHYLIRRRALLISTLNTDAKIFDNQYYLLCNTQSYTTLFFLIKFFGVLIKKTIKFTDNFGYFNVLRFRYWFGVRHLFSVRYIRRSFFLRGILARGLLNFCFRKITKSYRHIVLYNIYCTEFFSSLRHNYLANAASAVFLKKMHDVRLRHGFSYSEKKRGDVFILRFGRFKKRPKLDQRRSRYFLKSRRIRLYFFALMKKRIRLKRLLKLSLRRFFKGDYADRKSYRLPQYTEKIFLHLQRRRVFAINKALLKHFLEHIFFARRAKTRRLKAIYSSFRVVNAYPTYRFSQSKYRRRVVKKLFVKDKALGRVFRRWRRRRLPYELRRYYYYSWYTHKLSEFRPSFQKYRETPDYMDRVNPFDEIY